MATLWYARDAKAWIAPTIATVGTTTTLKTQQVSSVEFTAKCKEVRISGGERDLEAINTLGIGQLDQQGRPTIIECVLTLVYDDATKTGTYLGGTTVTIGTTGFRRIQLGEHVTTGSDPIDRVRKSVLVELDDGTNKVYALLNNAYATTREWGLAADGHVEETLTFKTLAQNYYEEDNMNSGE